MYPRPSMVAQHSCDFPPGKQPNFVAINILDRQQLVGRKIQHVSFGNSLFIGLTRGTWQRISFERPEMGEQSTNSFVDLRWVERLQKIIYRLKSKRIGCP